MPYNKMLCYHT